MKKAFKIVRILLAVAAVVWVSKLVLSYNPLDLQLLFLVPGIGLLSYSIIHDELYVRPTLLLSKGKRYRRSVYHRLPNLLSQ